MNLGLLSQEQLEAIWSRYLSASPGVWLWEEVKGEDGTDFFRVAVVVESGHITNLKMVGVFDGSHSFDCEFVTHARNDVYALLMEVQYLRGLLETLTPKIAKPEGGELS